MWFYVCISCWVILLTNNFWNEKACIGQRGHYHPVSTKARSTALWHSLCSEGKVAHPFLLLSPKGFCNEYALGLPVHVLLLGQEPCECFGMAELLHWSLSEPSICLWTWNFIWRQFNPQFIHKLLKKTGQFPKANYSWNRRPCLIIWPFQSW